MSKFFRFVDSYGALVAPLGDRVEEENACSQRRELAHRVNDGLEVTLSWHPTRDELMVSVCDQREDTYFEIRPERHLALEVYYHPYAYAALIDAHCKGELAG